MPTISSEDKDKLYMSVERARQMGKILTIPFPSGHIRNYINSGEGYPAVGSQYLFFLVKPDFPQAEYEVIIGAAYLLSGGKVHPLDDSQLGQFDNMSESVFMSKVELAIRS